MKFRYLKVAILLCTLAVGGCKKDNAPSTPGSSEASSPSGMAALGNGQAVEDGVGRDDGFEARRANPPVVSSPSAAAEPTEGALRMPAVLPTEKQVFHGKQLSAQKVGGVLRSDRFEAFRQSLENDARMDLLARETTEVQREMLNQRLEGIASLESLTCGHGVCVGSIDVGTNTAGYDEFVDQFMRDRIPNVGALLEYPMRLENGETQARFVMSIHPSLDSVSFVGNIPAPPRRPPPPQQSSEP